MIPMMHVINKVSDLIEKIALLAKATTKAIPIGCVQIFY
jgi:hypothetical protein